MFRSSSKVFASILALGVTAGCGDDGRVFNGPQGGDGGDGTSTSGDAGSELPTDDLTADLPGDASMQGLASSASDAGSSTANEPYVSTVAPATSGTSSGQAVDTTEPDTTVVLDNETSGVDTTVADDTATSGAADTSSEITSEQTSEVDSTGEPAVVVSLAAEGENALVGFAISLAATASASDGSTVTYTWELISTPNGSQVGNEDIAAVDSAASFYPDLAGDYVVRVTAATEAGEQTSQDVSVRGRAYDVGYLNVAGDQDSWTYGGFMVQSDGTNARQVGCYYQNTAASEQAWLSDFQTQGKLMLMPYLPNDGDTPARIAYSQTATDASYRMFIAGPTNDCNGNPPPQVVGGLFPTFSPNGQRVAVITSEVVADPANEGQTRTISNIVTYKVDGTDARLLRGEYGGSSSGVSWVDDETLTWIEDGDATRAYRVKDIAGAFENDLLSEVTLDCTGAANPIPAGINHAVERGGALFVASTYTAIFGGTSSYSIWRLSPTAGGTYDCNQDAPTNTKIAGDDAHDFDVNMDGTRLLYFVTVAATETETSASKLYLRDLSSMSEPLALSEEPSTIASGAHFSANGQQLIWTETKQVSTTVGETTYERPEQSRVIVANADGSHKRTLVTVSSTGSQARMFHTGGNSACSVSNVGAPGFFGVGGMTSLLGLASMVLRRRRRG